VLHVAVAAGRNRDRIYNDAPATVPDANGGGRINANRPEGVRRRFGHRHRPFRITD
jgi:hypothetical protein